MLNKMRLGNLILFLILEEMLSLFTIEYISCQFVVYSFYYVEVKCF